VVDAGINLMFGGIEGPAGGHQRQRQIVRLEGRGEQSPYASSQKPCLMVVCLPSPFLRHRTAAHLAGLSGHRCGPLQRPTNPGQKVLILDSAEHFIETCLVQSLGRAGTCRHGRIPGPAQGRCSGRNNTIKFDVQDDGSLAVLNVIPSDVPHRVAVKTGTSTTRPTTAGAA
jgi:hypothetical protein